MVRNRQAGTSLVELLVVIVIFAIGILGVLQVFPAGFNALTTSRSETMAGALGRATLEQMKGSTAQMPEAILAVTYANSGSIISITADPNRDNNNLSIPGVGIDQNGNVLDASNQVLGRWDLIGGPNIVRRIVGEGGRVPAPRAVGTDIGGLMTLQFAPIVFDPVYTVYLRVYGNDMVARYGQPFPGGRRQPYQFFFSDLDENNGQVDTLYLPVVPFPADPNESPYRVSFSFFVNTGGTISLREVVDPDPVAIRNALVTSINFPGYYTIDVPTLVANLGVLSGGEAYAGLDDSSVRVQKTFKRLNAGDPWSATDPYEYKILDAGLGVLLFNPNGYNYEERRPRGQRVPLVARANYDVLDWRIIRDEFRVGDAAPYQQKLILNSLKVRGEAGADARTYNGIGLPVSNGSGGSQDLDVVLQDVETGGIYLHNPSNPPDPTPNAGTTNDYLAVDGAQTSYVVDKSAGVVRFADFDETAPGLQLRLILPGAGTPITVQGEGRKVRALYQAKNEWSVQVLKAPSRYEVVIGTPSIAQCYVGGSSVVGGVATRVYFPGQDTGKKVTFGEIWYIAGAVPRVMRDQDFTIRTSASDPLGLPFIDVRDVDQQATSFDFTNGYAVRRVKGVSVSARVLWNNAVMRFGNDSAANMRAFEVWTRTWRKTVIDTYLEKGEN
jgi:type II secretory pathway pseudopilin PulG